MKRIIPALISIFLTRCITQPEPEKVPAVIYHMEGSQEAYGITETHDGNYYIITGWTDKGGEYYPPRCMLLKVDKEGNLVEKKVFLSLEWSCDAIIKAPDSNYLLRSNHYVVLIDDNLNIISRTYIPNSTPNFVVDVLDGRTYTTVRLTTNKAYAFLLSQNVEILDSFSYQLSRARSSVIETDASGNIYIAVQENDTLKDRHGYVFVKLNSDLDSVLVNFIDVGEIFGYSAGYVKRIERFGDGTMAIAGTVVRGFLDAFGVVFRVDTNGNLISYHSVDYSMTTFMDMTKVEGGDIVVVGSALRDGMFFTFVMRLRPDLSVMWYKEFLGDFDCYIGFGSVIQDSDGNLAIAGYCAGLDDMAFMKLDASTGEPIVWSER